jgi:hypothetical protein
MGGGGGKEIALSETIVSCTFALADLVRRSNVPVYSGSSETSIEPCEFSACTARRAGFDPLVCAMETFIGALKVLNLITKFRCLGVVK